MKKKKWLIIVATVNAVLLPMVVALGLGLYYDQAGIARSKTVRLATEKIPKKLIKTSWYGRWFGTPETANGERFDKLAMTAAHKTLPFGTVLVLRNHQNGKRATVRINDRGPFWEDRELDVTLGVAQVLGIVDAGVAHLEFRVIDPENRQIQPTAPPRVNFGPAAD